MRMAASSPVWLTRRAEERKAFWGGVRMWIGFVEGEEVWVSLSLSLFGAGGVVLDGGGGEDGDGDGEGDEDEDDVEGGNVL